MNAYRRTLAVLTLVTSLCLTASLPSTPAEAQAPIVMTHHVPDAVLGGRAPVVGVVPETQRMGLSILLPLRNQGELNDLLRSLYDPSSSSYKQFLTVKEFTDQFGPTAADYLAVQNFAERNGLTITSTSANRLVLGLTGSVGAIDKAFHITLRNYRHPTENRVFFAPDREPSPDLSVALWHIGGLNNYSIPRPLYSKADLNVARSNATGSGLGGNFLGSDRRAAYAGGTTLTGAGQTVGLFELGGYNLSDVQAYFNNVHQPLNVPINNILLEGAGAGSTGDDTEQVVDIIEAISMAPGLSQVRVYIARTGSSFRPGVDDTAILNRMATENIAKQLSCSFAWKPADANQDEPLFEEFIAQGQSFFVASGDSGSYVSGDFVYPAEDPYVTAVGGTDLTTNGAGGSWASETAWIGSGGGPAPDPVAIPGYQLIPGVITSSNRASSTRRNIPDVSAEANTDNYSCANGICGGGLGGTSLAAPTWAGLVALANQESTAQGKASAVGFLNYVIYPFGVGSSYHTDFHDITGGTNSGYSAVPGYDLATGWGTPNGINTINALADYTEDATGLLGFSGQFACDGDGDCDTGTIGVTVNNTTETIPYDGSGVTGPGLPQTIVAALVSAFNSDPSSPVVATSVEDTYLGSNAYDVAFTAKKSGPGGDYPTSISVNSNYGSLSAIGTPSIEWTWTPSPFTGGANPNTLTEVSPLSGYLTGGR